MNLKVYLIYDRTAEEYGTPVFYKNKAVAARNVKCMVEKQPYSKNDFILYEVGNYDTEKGTIEMHTNKEIVELNYAPTGEEI